MNINERITKGESFVSANDGQFLGKLSLNKYDYESISNSFGPYGNKFSSTSINNGFSLYGSRYSSLSPNNPYTLTPPKVYLRGVFWGFLSVNRFIYGNVLNPLELNKWMQTNGLFF